MTPLITRNTTIPVSKSQVFSTAEDNQPAVDIVVYQGERPMARDNKMLGHFKLEGIKPARRGEPRIEVTFNIDANGIVNVKAKDLDSQKEQSITITGTNGLSKEEIDKMIKEAEANKEADEKRRENAELRNKAEQLLSTIDKSLEEQGDKMDEKQKADTLALRDEIKKALDSEDYATLKTKIDQLEQAAAAFSQYQQQNGGSSNDSSNSNDGNVYDADYTESN
jgi:molecular chaperone DnaK